MKLAFVFLLFFPLQVCLATDVDEILDQVDKLYRSNTSQALIEMEIITPNWQRKLSMDIWTKGMDYTFVTIQSPKKDRGVSSLKRKNEMWNYFPKINKVIKIPPSMMMSSWMGSDFTNDDLVKENTLREDYTSKLENSDNAEEYKITLTPKKQIVSVWGSIILFIDKKSMLPTRQEYFDEKNAKIRTMVFTDVGKIGGKRIPLTMELIPHTKEGNKTIVRYKKMAFNIKLPANTFTRENLQKRR